MNIVSLVTMCDATTSLRPEPSTYQGSPHDPDQQYSSNAYQNGDDYGYEPKREEEEPEESLSQAHAWMVIDSFFEDKGLVRQQLESFNEFIENSMQEIVDERSRLTLDQHTQYTGLAGDETVSCGGHAVRKR